MAMVQTCCYDEKGELLHAGPQTLPRSGVRPGTIRRWMRNWKRWAITAVDKDCPTGIAVLTRKQVYYWVQTPGEDGGQWWKNCEKCGGPNSANPTAQKVED